jgi:hypothetical protein
VDKFIGRYLAELDARLHSPVQIRGGGSVFEILTKLAEAGLELAIDARDEASAGRPTAREGTDIRVSSAPAKGK